jgi:glucose-1-phosphate adenylyltransferase
MTAAALHVDVAPEIGAEVSMAHTATLILAGGRGSRLGALTARRAKPAMPMAGQYRLIDFTLANCQNSGIARADVLTQHLADSLEPHLAKVWARTDAGGGVYARSLRAVGGSDECGGYRGTADAVYQNLPLLRVDHPEQVLILAGDHAYRMDYRAMLAEHLRRRARLTVGCVRVPLDLARGFGVVQVDAAERICSFAEKPARPEPLPAHDDLALVSMGIYIFDIDFLSELLHADAAAPSSSHDFGHDVLPAAVAAGGAYAYTLRDPDNPQRQGYWCDVGTIDAYRRTNLEIALGTARLGPGSDTWPLRLQQQPTAQPQDGRSIVSGARVSASATLSRSVLFPGVHVGPAAFVQGTVVLAGSRIGAGSVIADAVIEEGCEIPAGMVIGMDRERDRRRFHVSAGGTVLVTPEMLARLALSVIPPHPPATSVVAYAGSPNAGRPRCPASSCALST